MLAARHLSILLLGLVPAYLIAGPVAPFGARIPIYDKGASTYYVPARVNGRKETEFMVDTGSGYTTINEQMLSEINDAAKPVYLRSILGVLADGSEISMPIYRISSLNIGGNCVIRNVEVAVLPGQTRNILGLSALKLLAPFSLFVDPPAILLSNCGTIDDLQVSEAAAL